MGLDETSYLLKNPKNASGLLDGIKDYENGDIKIVEFKSSEFLNTMTIEKHQSSFTNRKEVEDKRPKI